MSGGARARDHLEAIARTPRPAGGLAESAAREYCAAVLRNAGFDVRAEPFDYSAFPGRYATAAAGALSTTLLLAAALLGARGRPGAALVTLTIGGAALAVVALWLARVGVLHAPLMRRRATNLTATRGATPKVWLVAHLDSKSQPVPILVRAGAIALHGVTWAAAALLAAVGWLGAVPDPAWHVIGVTALGTGAPIVASVVGAASAGAVDNASGVAAVLLTAVSLPRGSAVGVVITSAEELGLAGARAWVVGRAPATALNCDGIDDRGGLLCMYTGRRPEQLSQSFLDAARAEGQPLRVRRLLPGVLVDGVAFADAGWNVLTLSRGSAATLRRIHTRLDCLDVLTGQGIDDAVPIVTRVAQQLL